MAAKGHAVPRVPASTKLIEARAHARENGPRALRMKPGSRPSLRGQAVKQGQQQS
ncbi:hypothetical protein AB0G67_45325 [Streptomyces sp. NPDC021056]|uniref:hypothetical protein n=1 Tax=Streptomyces sp. NPDC021056 TaxID=3155012 RepID=UPI0033DC2CEF